MVNIIMKPEEIKKNAWENSPVSIFLPPKTLYLSKRLSSFLIRGRILGVIFGTKTHYNADSINIEIIWRRDVINISLYNQDTENGMG